MIEKFIFFFCREYYLLLYYYSVQFHILHIIAQFFLEAIILMLVLFETAAGYALFEVLKEGKLKEPDELWKEFETPEAAKKTYVFFKV